ncbi:exosortase Q [Ramlibacter tataouinensis]|uniref:Candidate membrane protein n=1 Tax=Ramlibacter tataouinensis (strain ATCC BAA-407 / DSM 14655 / LMG 21543 / TTB310) TaxID=365046 RepID=F5Y2E1_RAMTT|nr:exosortase Q [Ramlibacter tataouinensis]AEG91115.1 candidate membrane protein [Ramlibacter tataouinensis TTB310]
MNLPRLLRMPALVRWGVRIDTAPDALWLALLAAALWPTWWWMGRRLADGSDDPLGLLALAALAVLAWRSRHRLRAAPRLGWLLAALGCVLLATAGQGLLPPLALALASLLGLAAGLAAFLPPGTPRAPVTGLAVLSLPLLASLQFYAGYPLRVLTAEASRWLLGLVFRVEREGATLWVEGRRVIVDAPCSGVQMVWFGYFTACVAALLLARGDRAFLTRLPAVGALVLAGNVLRNTLLVAAEGAGRPLPGWAHEVAGLAVLAAVCAGVGWVMSRPEATRRPA